MMPDTCPNCGAMRTMINKGRGYLLCRLIRRVLPTNYHVGVPPHLQPVEPSACVDLGPFLRERAAGLAVDAGIVPKRVRASACKGAAQSQPILHFMQRTFRGCCASSAVPRRARA